MDIVTFFSSTLWLFAWGSEKEGRARHLSSVRAGRRVPSPSLPPRASCFVGYHLNATLLIDHLASGSHHLPEPSFLEDVLLLGVLRLLPLQDVQLPVAMKPKAKTRPLLPRWARQEANTQVVSLAQRRRERLAAARRRRALNLWVPLAASTGARLSALESRSVRPQTQKQYQQAVEELLAWCSRNRLSVATSDELDRAVTDYLDEMYFDGWNRHVGSGLLAALQHFWPQLGYRTELELPRSRRALRGWGALAPATTRMPMPWLGLMGVVGVLIYSGRLLQAIAVLTMFQGCLRPGEVMDVTPEQFVRPADVGGIVSSWGVVIRPLSGGRPTKTHAFDESVLLDLDKLAFLGDFYETIKVNAPAGQPVWGFTQQHLVEDYRHAAWAAMCDQLNTDLYALRHGGASFDRLTNRRGLEEVQRRGRWHSFSSVVRYEKATRALQELEKMPPEARAFAETIEANLESFMRGLLPVPTPPRWPGATPPSATSFADGSGALFAVGALGGGKSSSSSSRARRE